MSWEGVNINEVIVIIENIRKNKPASLGLSLVETATVRKKLIRTEITLITPEREYVIITL